MWTIVEDTVGRHDFLLTPCSPDTFRIIYGNTDPHPSCFANLAQHLAPFGIAPDAIPTTLNVFMNVMVAPDGELTIGPPRSKAGDCLLLRAEMDQIVGVTACSAELSNNGSFKPIDVEVLDALAGVAALEHAQRRGGVAEHAAAVGHAAEQQRAPTASQLVDRALQHPAGRQQRRAGRKHAPRALAPPPGFGEHGHDAERCRADGLPPLPAQGERERREHGELHGQTCRARELVVGLPHALPREVGRAAAGAARRTHRRRRASRPPAATTVRTSSRFSNSARPS